MPETNALINSQSPYLLQHAYQSINWLPWGKQALTKALQEDKPILMSIGYAACHWCHVMARETFENKEVAAIMCASFINIKIDREENPDVDQVAIEALQTMGLPVGWPLHIFLMPNQEPFYGGSYFATADWKTLLTQIAFAFNNHRQELANSAFYFANALQKNRVSHYATALKNFHLNDETVQQIFKDIYHKLDHCYGGILGSPKFLMPSISTFLLHYYQYTNAQEALDQANLTLSNIAFGGIYDNIGGGFFRYATDEAWMIPHFEKMLYDNAQLLSLYAYAYIITKNGLYKQVILATIKFLIREMRAETGLFYSSLDSDSQGLEGGFYTWTYQEIYGLLGQERITNFLAYYHISLTGNWQAGRNVLYKNPHLILEKTSKFIVDEQLRSSKEILFNFRYSNRVPPAVNKQIIAAWNGMMLQALVDLYYALGDVSFLTLAIENANALVSHLTEEGKLLRICHTRGSSLDGYLEDYAWVAKAFISLYQATFEEKWLYQAEKLAQYTLKYFKNIENNLFYFTNVNENIWMKRTQEIFDQVIPSSNAVMAEVLFLLGKLLKDETYTTCAQKMLITLMSLLKKEPLYMTYWAKLCLFQLHHIPMLIIVGHKSTNWGLIIKQHCPEIVLAGAVYESNIPWITHYMNKKNKTTIYICTENACQPPLYNVEEAIQILKERAYS